MADGEVAKPPENAPKPPPSREGENRPTHSQFSSYADVVQGQLLSELEQLHPNSYKLKPTSFYQNKPAVVFTSTDKKALLETMKHVLVGKFTHGRPSFGIIKDFFVSLKLRGKYNLSFYDAKHIFIECEFKADFTRLWMRLIWHIKGYAMRVFKWDLDFSPFKESPVAPVWIRIEGLPLYMFDENTLLSLANSIGKPLRVDPRNINRINLSSARICVELDVSLPLVDAIWVSFVDALSHEALDGFWVRVFFDVVPPYCSFCAHICHHLGDCKRRTEQENGVDKVFDNLTQPGISAAGKVFDGWSQPNNSKGMITRVGQAIENNRSNDKGTDLALVRTVCNDGLVQENVVDKVLENLTQPGISAVGNVLDQLPQPAQRGNKHGKKVAYAQVWKEKHGTGELNSQRQAISSRGKSLQIDNMVQDVAQTSSYDLHDIAEAESSVSGQRLGKGNYAAKVFDKLSELSSVTDLVPPLGDAFDMADLHGGQHGGETVIDEGVITIETSDIQTNKYDFHTPNKTWVEHISGKFSCEHGAAALGQQEQLQQIGDTKHGIGSFVASDLGHKSSKTETNYGEIGKVWPGNQNSAMQVQNNSQQQDVGIETTYTQLMDPNNLSCKENKMLALMLDYNASKMDSKVKVLLNYVEDLKQKIDNADSTTVARIAASPSTKAFLKNQVKPHTFSPLPMADLVGQVDNQDPSYSKNVKGIGDNDNGPLVTVLPKLCYEQVSKQQARSTTVQIAHLGEGSGIVKTALLQLKDKGWITDRGLPFDDNG